LFSQAEHVIDKGPESDILACRCRRGQRNSDQWY
jgi:hypothetical protein